MARQLGDIRRDPPRLTGCTQGVSSVLVPLRHNRFTPRSFPSCHYFNWERGPTAKKSVMKKKSKKKTKT
jgi:hypothetical protein